MRNADRGWELHNITVPEGTCRHCPYKTRVFVDGSKVGSSTCLIRFYSERGDIGIARAFNTKGIPPDCDYLSLRR